MAPADSARIEEARKIAKTDTRKAEEQYKEIISKPPSVTSDAAVREYETALVSLGELYRDERYGKWFWHVEEFLSQYPGSQMSLWISSRRVGRRFHPLQRQRRQS
jgi:26S proteasome regulatory subunit N6